MGIDGFKVGKKVTTTPVLTNVAWARITRARRPAAEATRPLTRRAEIVKLTFRGTGVDFVTARCAGCGKAGVYVDGALVAKCRQLRAGRQLERHAVCLGPHRRAAHSRRQGAGH